MVIGVSSFVYMKNVISFVQMHFCLFMICFFVVFVWKKWDKLLTKVDESHNVYIIYTRILLIYVFAANRYAKRVAGLEIMCHQKRYTSSRCQR
jgi:hypothetical protein